LRTTIISKLVVEQEVKFYLPLLHPFWLGFAQDLPQLLGQKSQESELVHSWWWVLQCVSSRVHPEQAQPEMAMVIPSPIARSQSAVNDE